MQYKSPRLEIHTNLFYTYMHVAFLLCTESVIHAKQLAVESEIERVLKLSRNIKDPHLLDHTVATLSILASSLEAHTGDPDTELKEEKSFTIVDKFAPAEKNELQPRFKRTTDSAGRKQKLIPLCM